MTSTDQQLRDRVVHETVASEFLRTVERQGDRTALRWLTSDTLGEDATWGELSFNQLADRVARTAAALAELGVQRGDRVVLMMRNIPEFHWIDLAVVFLGATPVSIYNSSSADQVAYLAGHAGAKVAIVEDQGFLDRFLEVRGELPTIGTYVLLNGTPDPATGVLAADALDSGQPLDLTAAVSNVDPALDTTIIYTSGTTGNPKGVRISHFNARWIGESLLESLGWTLDQTGEYRLISYLPMAHVAERVVTHYGMAFYGFQITTCPEVSKLADYARAVRPNVLFGVPRVFEKVYAGVNAVIQADPEKATKFAEAIAAAEPIREAMTWGTATDEEIATYEFLDAVAFSTVRQLLGMDELVLAVSGAAPMPADLLRWFRTIGIPLTEIYGMSENGGPLAFSAWKPRPGWVGPPLPGAELRIAEDGEVLARGGLVFPGYLNDPEKTAEALDNDGWLHTGDIGEISDDGYLRIVDRKKELIITAGGKNISPANLEAALKTIPLVGQAAAVGDNRPFVAALVVLDPEYAPVWAAQHGIEGLSLNELAEHPAVIAEIEGALDGAMADFNNAERVKKVKVLGEEWLPDSDLLTPTSKLKRRGVAARFAAEIEAFYA